MKIRLYGPMTGQTSWPRVARGIRGALEHLNLLAGVYDIQSVLDDDDAFSPGFDAEVGLFVGPPSECVIMSSRGRHTERLAMVAANSTWLPETTMRFMREHVTGFVAPSEWAADVLSKYSGGKPVYLYSHGVSPEFKSVGLDRYRKSKDGPFSVAHFASTTMQRKGTMELLTAWAHIHDVAAHAWPRGQSELHLYVDGSDVSLRSAIRYLHELYPSFDPESVQIRLPVKLDEKSMSMLYQAYHVICQPSRSEGFGLVPLEALCSGVPVVLTRATGHREYIYGSTPGVVPIRCGADEPIDDGPGAMAPSLNFYDVASALTVARQKWHQLAGSVVDGSKDLSKEWSWEETTKDFVDELRTAISAKASSGVDSLPS